MDRIDRLAHDNRLADRHPAEKLLFAGGMLLLALTLPPWPGSLAVVVAVTVAALGVARLPSRDFAAVLAVPVGFIAAGALVLPVSLAPAADGSWSVSLSAEGMRAAGLTSLRALAGAECLVFLALTTRAADLVSLLHRVGVPAGLVDVVLLTYRFIGLLADCAARGAVAQAARLGWRGMAGRVRSAGLLAAALLPRALERARRSEIGLAARGFSGGLPVLSRHRPPAIPALALVAAVLVATAAAGLGG